MNTRGHGKKRNTPADIKAEASDSTATNNRRSRRKQGLEPAPAAQPVASPFQAPPMPAPHDGFNAEDMTFLAYNENVRYAPAKSAQIAHAVFVTNPDGSKTAYQYALPAGDGTPTVVPLSNIRKIIRFGATRYMATGPNGQPLYARRYTQGKVNLGQGEEDVEIAYFSDPEQPGKEPFFGGTKSTDLFRTDLPEQDQKELDEELASMPVITKGGTEMKIDHESVRIRDQNKVRKPDQNTVMGESACDAFAGFLENWEGDLTVDAKKFFKQAIEAPLRDAVLSNKRPEWLHLEGFSLTPVDKDPQRKDNLGAAPKWSNTTMMVLERLLKWFAMNRPQSYLSLKPMFTMLLNSELVKHIHFEVDVKEQGRELKFIQDIDPFKRWPLPPKATDLAQLTGIAHSMITGIRPVMQQHVLTGEAPPIIKYPVTSLHALANDSAPGAAIPSAPGFTRTTSSPTAVAGLFAAPQPARVAPLHRVDPAQTAHHSDRHNQSPDPHAQLNYDECVIQVLMTTKEYDYEFPWRPPTFTDHGGTGLVVQAPSGKLFILTNAHCVENISIIRARRANDRKKYEAKVVSCCYQSDLALLEVDDPEFLRHIKPVKIGKMVKSRDVVQTVGFPMGGREVSISEGIVSRIEVQDYAMSDELMLQVQVDAAINPGNSGGPVFARDGSVVGVAFQGYDRQGLGFMIPTPIIEHFLREALAGKKKPVFPVLPIRTQTLENPSLRNYYHLGQQSGLRITRVQKMGDAATKLKVDDIMLEVEGHVLSNDGKVDIEGIGKRIDYRHLLHMKYVGDSVRVKVWRKDEQTGVYNTHEVNVKVEYGPSETEKVGEVEHDKMPTYFMVSGIVFSPVTHNYVNDRGPEFESMQFAEANCDLLDYPKESADEQFVVLSHVLECKHTEGYGNYENTLVKEVNGVKIRNLRDLINAIESNQGHEHIIICGNRVMAIPHLSDAETKSLMKRYHIPFDRSEDLRVDAELVQAQVAAVNGGEVNLEDERDVRAAVVSLPVAAAHPARVIAASAPTPSTSKAKALPPKEKEEADDGIFIAEDDDRHLGTTAMLLGSDADEDEEDDDDFDENGEFSLSGSGDEDGQDWTRTGINPDKVSPGVLSFLGKIADLDARLEEGAFDDDEIVVSSPEVGRERHRRQRDRSDDEAAPAIAPIGESKRLKQRRFAGFFDGTASGSNNNSANNNAPRPPSPKY